MDYADFLAKLNIRIGDNDNFTFTPEEKEEALNEAFNDESVVKTIWDDTLVFGTTIYQYPFPNSISAVKDIYIKASNSTSSDPEPISNDLWDVVDDTIQFVNRANSRIPSGYTLYIKGVYKFTTSDTVDDVELQEYILKAAQFRCLGLLSNKKVFRFLRNDTSVSELIAAKRDLEQDLIKYKQRLSVEYESA